MTIALASDHAGFTLKSYLVAKLKKEGFQVLDFGTENERSVDYPDFARKASEAVTGGKADFAVLTCGTGLGMVIAANKMPGTRAVNCQCLFTAGVARSHNNANILCLGGRILGPDLAWAITRTFLETPFAGGRHLRRIQAIRKMEKAGTQVRRQPRG